MIINIRGTSGSGKSTLVRNIMAQYDTRAKVLKEGRKQPIGYICHKEGHKTLGVLGHYETACGGCDTITSMDAIFDLVRKTDDAGMHVLYEGLLLASDTERMHALVKEGRQVAGIYLKMPAEVCLASVAERRAARGNLEPLNPKNTLAKIKMCESSTRRLRERGVDIRELNREESFQFICQSFGLAIGEQS